jgi:beta-phosphoglucomutase-like phosphatase (HAD superfamily)
MGASNEMIERLYLSHSPLEEQAATLAAKEEAYRADLGDFASIAGAAGLLDCADLDGLKRAVVTNAPRDNAETAACRAADRRPPSDSGYKRELAGSKPDPLPYLTALERTGALASRSVAVEDSLSGVRCAAAAGLAKAGITTANLRAD